MRERREIQHSLIFEKAIEECGGKEWFNTLLEWHEENSSIELIEEILNAITKLVAENDYEHLKSIIMYMDEMRSRPKGTTGDAELDKIVEEFGGYEKHQSLVEKATINQKLMCSIYLEEISKATKAKDYKLIRELMNSFVIFAES